MSGTKSKSPLLILTWVCIVAGACVVRIMAARGGMWLDEVYTIDLLRTVDSVWTILTNLPYDTNHVLYSVLMYATGQPFEPLSYRWPSILAGAGSVIVAGLLTRRFGTASALFAGVLIGFTHLMIFFGSEARGYSLMTFFALTGALALDRHFEKPRLAWIALFSISCSLGMLSHLLFLQAYFALGLWGAAMRWPWRWNAIAEGLLLHTLPFATAAFLYFVLIRRMEVVGAIEFTLMGALQAAAASLVGVRPGSLESSAALAVVAAVVIGGVTLLILRRDRLWIFFAMLGLASPALTIAMSSLSVLQPRHFMLSLVCALLLASIMLGLWARQGGMARIGAVAACAALLWASAGDTVHLIRFGRGQYGEIVQTIAERSPRAEVLVSGDHDVRHRMMVEYYAPTVAPAKTIRYLTHEMSGVAPPEWIILHDFEFEPRARPTITDRVTGRTYALVAAYPRAKHAGWNCYLYQHVSSP